MGVNELPHFIENDIKRRHMTPRNLKKILVNAII
jgi:hypothetical protein